MHLTPLSTLANILSFDREHKSATFFGSSAFKARDHHNCHRSPDTKPLRRGFNSSLKVSNLFLTLDRVAHEVVSFYSIRSRLLQIPDFHLGQIESCRACAPGASSGRPRRRGHAIPSQVSTTLAIKVLISFVSPAVRARDLHEFTLKYVVSLSLIRLQPGGLYPKWSLCELFLFFCRTRTISMS